MLYNYNMAAEKAKATAPRQNARHHVRRARKSMIDIAPDVFSQPVSGFVMFLREHAIVGLAIGFVIGTQVQSMVKQLTDSFINPLFALLFSGNKSLAARTFTLHFGGRHANFGWGAFAYALLDFLFVLAVLYTLIKLFGLDKLDKKK